MPIDPTDYLAKDPLIADLPKANLAAWHAANKASGITLVDLSKNGHDVTAASNAPVMQQGVVNGLPAVYFDGTKNPLASADSLANLRHMFIVAALDEATFSAARGLLSGASANPVLVGVNADTKFADQSFPTGFEYRRSFVEFTAANQQAPVDGTFRVLEIFIPTGISLTGFQFGQDRADTAKRWKGWFAESLLYTKPLNTLSRALVYEYFARKYNLWQYVAEGYALFPFPAGRNRSLEIDQEHFLSQPYSGESIALLRGRLAGEYSLQYAIRTEAEWRAARKFHSQHYPDPSKYFILQDWRHYPPDYTPLRITSALSETGLDVSYRFNYGFSAKEPETAITMTAPKEIVIDTDGPALAITVPAAGAEVSGSGTIEGTVTDQSAIGSVELFIDNVSIGNATLGTGTFTKSIDWSGYSTGAHTIKAIATDALGNSSETTRNITKASFILDGIANVYQAVSLNRKLKGSHSGSAMKLKNSATSVTEDIGYVGSLVDAAEIESLRTMWGASNTRFKEGYCNVGGPSIVSIGSPDPLLEKDANGNYFLKCEAGVILQTVATHTITGLKLLIVIKFTSLAGLQFILETGPAKHRTYMDNNASNPRFGMYNGAGHILSAGGVADTNLHVLSFNYEEGANDHAEEDNISIITGECGGGAQTGKISIGSADAGGSNVLGQIGEFIIFNGTLSSGNRGTIITDQKTKYGI